MRFAASRRRGIAAIGVLVAACHPRATTQMRGECVYAPPDSRPIPPIVVKTEIGNSGTIAIGARDFAGEVVRLTAVLDREQVSSSANGNVRFVGVRPGERTLSLRSFGYGQRDTVVRMPREGGLRLTVPFSRGGGATICSDFMIRDARGSPDELATIFGALAFDSIGRSQGGIPTEIRWFAADTFTFRLLHPHALNRGLHLDILHGARPSCSWNTSSATREAGSVVGFLFELATRRDSAGNFLADVQMSCMGPSIAGLTLKRGNFGTGIVVQLVKQDGKWRIAKVVDHWIT